MRGVSLKSKRRNSFDITRDILKVCRHSANKTQIVSAANLNNKRINRYIEFCLRMKLLTEQFNGRHFDYRTTIEGIQFLDNYYGTTKENHYQKS